MFIVGFWQVGLEEIVLAMCTRAFPLRVWHTTCAIGKYAHIQCEVQRDIDVIHNKTWNGGSAPMECPPQVQVLKCKRQKSMHIEDGLGVIVFIYFF